MNTLESHEKTPYQAVEEVVNSIEPADLDLLKEFVQLPENPDYQMLSSGNLSLRQHPSEKQGCPES